MRSMLSALLLLTVAASSCGSEPDFAQAGPADERCNGAKALCARRYDEVAHPTTHNAMSNADELWAVPNQNHGISQQLVDGIRGLMLDAHPYEGDVYLCHGVCEVGNTLLAEGLAEITRFVESHPREVVSIIFESYVAVADIERAFEQSGLISFVHAHPPGEPWLTIGQLIEKNERVVVLTDDGGGQLDWYHDVWELAFETHYSAKTPDELSCAINRGDSGNDLFILNHFLTDLFGSPDFAQQVNVNPLFADRAMKCANEHQHVPNFVTVDFYDVGDLFSVCNTLNGLED